MEIHVHSLALSMARLYLHVVRSVTNWYVSAWLVYCLLHYIPSLFLRGGGQFAAHHPPFFVWRRRRAASLVSASLLEETAEEADWVQYSRIEEVCGYGDGDRSMLLQLQSSSNTFVDLEPPFDRVVLLSVENGSASAYRHVVGLHMKTPAKRGKRIAPVFLFAEYSHPSMASSSTKIELRLDGDMFCEGNEILSRVFVLRLLTFQNTPFVFSDTYRLTVVDDRISEFQIGWNEYILIEGGGGGGGGGPQYSIRSVDIPTVLPPCIHSIHPSIH